MLYNIGMNGRRTSQKQAAYDAARKSRYRKKYGVEVGYYDELLAVQSGTCAICREAGNSDTCKELFDIDHNHRTGLARGLLCNRCNHLVAVYERGNMSTVPYWHNKVKYQELYNKVEDYVKGYLEFAEGWHIDN